LAVGHQNAIYLKLEAARKELLDLGLRNPLLNYRPLRSRGLEVVDELPSEIFRLLVREGKSMTFLPSKEDDAPGLLAQPEGENLENGLAIRHTDLKLQTNLTSIQLQSRLLATYYSARTFIEEQGVNILYVALGMLKWYEADNSQNPFRAPLLLIPIELERSNARERFHLKYTGEDIGDNLSLAAKLKMEFGLALPSLPDLEDLGVAAYFNSIEEAVQSQPRWSVESGAVVLGFFSFGKFLMYRDLDVTRWPKEVNPANHPVIEALLSEGFREPDFQIKDEDHLDQHPAIADLHQVVDADSSQSLAIVAANQNHNLVIQGPPGTGKSQTITNIIAEAIGQGKTVLFVSEKMAALEVVKRRLDKIGLGDACLELHSHKTQKKAVLDNLTRTLDLGKPKLRETEIELKLLAEGRDRLNEYCEAINTPIKESGLTPFEAFGELIQLRRKYKEHVLPQIEIPEMLSWSRSEFKRREALVEEMQSRVAQMGIPEAHPFWGSRRKVFLPTEQERLKQAISKTKDAVLNLQASSAKLAHTLTLQEPATSKDNDVLCRTAQRIIESPSLKGIELRSPDWLTHQEDLRKLLLAGSTLADLHKKYDEILIPEAWKQDVLQIRQDLAAYGRKWWRFLSGTYRGSRNRLAGLCREALPKGIDEQLKMVEAILDAQRQQETISRYESVGRKLFGTLWHGESSEWSSLSKLMECIVQVHQDINNKLLPERIIDVLASNPDLAQISTALSNVEASVTSYINHAREIINLLDVDEALRFGVDSRFEDQEFSVQTELLSTWAARISELQAMVAYNLLADMLRKEGLEEVVSLSRSWPQAANQLTDAFRHSWFEKLVEHVFQERRAIARFDGDSHEHVIRKFRELDVLMFQYNRSKLAYAHWQKLPNYSGAGQLSVLRREFEKKSRHLPIRQLMLKAGNAIKAIKPVFMMSPLSIATFLPPDSISFDLVVFDEASQVKPVDAFGAIFRGKQAVVVGDSRQMPPTSFFDSLTKGEEADEENVTSDIESILGLFSAQGAPQKMLRWHYRSRHESLIAVSNQEFYDSRLVVFPSPDASKQEMGLIFHHLPETAYDRGRSRTNPLEAKAVAQAVMKHAREQMRLPAKDRLTLGVAAFSVAQMQAIQDQLELLRRQDSSCEEYFAGHPDEPFFVKNLETVQGDERDVIFISIGYGRTAEGYVAMEFGPINRDGGERRLNVLITRARLRCEVFTNLTADDIDLNRTNARGVRALKTFLSYARDGRLDVAVVSGEAFDSPFEEGVQAELTGLGYDVKQQVGSAGFFIDLAVIDAERPGRYLLGIECDGASYHSARSARDRDRLRQQVLEGLGWRIHRIWSTDYFRDPDRELKRVVEAIEQAKIYGHALDNRATPEGESQNRGIERDSNTEQEDDVPNIPPYIVAGLLVNTGGLELHRVAMPMIADWKVRVVQTESPVHISEVARRIADAAGVRCVASRIQAAIESASSFATRSGAIRRKGDFLWMTSMEQPAIRDRSSLPSSSRKIDLIAPEEIALAIEKAVADSCGMNCDDVPAAACRLFGIMRVSEETKSHVYAIVQDLISADRLANQGDHLVIGKNQNLK
jgi:very-short-patch-repair endonuclease